MFFSLFSMVWALFMHTDVVHLTVKKLYKRGCLSMLTYVFWQSGMVTARVVSVVLLATVFHAYVLLALGRLVLCFDLN